MPAADDEDARCLAASRPVGHRGLAPRGLWGHARGALALATAVGMVPRGHRHATDLRTLHHVAGASGLAEALVLVIDVRDLPDRRHAAHRDPAHLPGGQTHLREVALL